MRKSFRILSILLAVMTLVCGFSSAFTASAAGSNWAGSWGTPAIESGVVLGSDSALAQSGIHLRDYIPAGSSVRTTITPTLGGTKIRLKFSNLFGVNPITINETTIATTGVTDDMVDANSITQVTFNGGMTSVTIAPGSEVLSDEINFVTTAMKKVSVTTYYRSTTPMYTVGLYGGKSYLASSLGNRTHKEAISTVATRMEFSSGSISYNMLPFLTRLDVYAENAYSVVIIGDSTVANDSYLLLAEKLQKNGITNVGVIMSGIMGNRLLADGVGLLGKVYGQSLLTRAKRDAFSVPGVRYVIVKIGENDILHPLTDSMKGLAPEIPPSDIIEGYKELARQVTGTNIKMYLCTKTPYKGYTRNFLGSDELRWSQKTEDKLLELNKWIKNSASSYYAGVVNLDPMRDSRDSGKLRDQLTTDGIHFSQLGQIAFVDLIPEAAYGVNRELKDLAAIRGVDPYTAPVAPTTAAPTTSAPANNDQPTQRPQQEQTTNNTVVTPVVPTTEPTAETTTSSAPMTQFPMNDANQILLGGENTTASSAGSVSDENNFPISGNMVIFALVAMISAAIVAVASIMLTKYSPKRPKRLTRGAYDVRARHRRRV